MPARPSRRRPILASAGFTLLEMMLVVVIIGLLATVVVYNLTGQTTAALRGTTVVSMSQIKNALSQYYSKNGGFPPTLLPLATPPGGTLEKIPKDGWKHDFFYLYPGQDATHEYTLISAGKDGKIGTADDINVWTMDEQQ